VIDGQQRLTTTMLLLKALSKHLGDAEPIDGFSASKIQNRYLIDPDEKDDRRFKLSLTETDDLTLKAIVEDAPLPETGSNRILSNFNWFDGKIKDLDGDVESLCKGLDKLIVVDVNLQRGEDNPQLIFESMNSTGRELSQADLIRNFVLMGLEPEEQTKLYRNYWRQMELKFGQEAYTAYFDSFMRHYLTIKSGEVPNVNQVYEAFKRYANSEIEKGYESLVSDINAYASYYCAMALGAETETSLKEAFQDLRELRVDVAYPLLLEMYGDYKAGNLLLADFERAVRLVEAYVFRRAVCSIPTNSMNKTFANFTKELDKTRYLSSIKASFQMLPSYRRFPSDDEFVRDLKTRDLYNFARRSYWLRRVENFGRKERIAVDNFSIEHIMPQNEALNAQWQKDLGAEWKSIHAEKLHTLGNLTLTAYNSEYSDHSFLDKRNLKDKGLKSSPLALNEGLGEIEAWNLQEIENRASRLSEKALVVWPAPDLPSEILETFRQLRTIGSRDSTYEISHFPQISGDGKLRHLFELLQAEIFSLDPCVTIGYLKLYVAFKAETNFVDVIPQSKRLRLSINMPYPDLVDPEGRARDITGMGKWGNGDCSIFVSHEDDISYAIGLVRQSLERQLVEAS
jgi:uncharacterized protein with ParB-like and HNH nuclease domain/predicted transport protein